MSEQWRAIIRVLESADEPLSPKEITGILNAKGMHIFSGAVREVLSQMAKVRQAKNLGRGQYVHPDYEKIPDNADILTNGEGLCQFVRGVRAML